MTKRRIYWLVTSQQIHVQSHVYTDLRRGIKLPITSCSYLLLMLRHRHCLGENFESSLGLRLWTFLDISSSTRTRQNCSSHSFQSWPSPFLFVIFGGRGAEGYSPGVLGEFSQDKNPEVDYDEARKYTSLHCCTFSSLSQTEPPPILFYYQEDFKHSFKN